MRERFLGLVNKYRSLRARRDAGRLSDEEFRGQLEACAVPDPDNPGHWWNISPESGLWVYFDGKEWVPRAPEGFDPDIGPITPVPTQRTRIRRGGGPKMALIAVIAVVVVAAIAVGVWFLLQQLGGPGGGEKAKDEIEEALETFYEALDSADAGDLEEITTGDMAERIESEQEGGTLNTYAREYRGADIEVDEIEIDGEEATATVEISRGGRSFEQEVDLELADGAWKVADLGRMKPLSGRAGTASGTGGSTRTPSSSTEEEIRFVVEDFFQAYKRLDFDSMREILTGQALSSFESYEESLQDPSLYETAAEMMENLTWDILDITLMQNRAQAEARVKISASDTPTVIKLKLAGNQWKITNVGY